jgi:uncharacterized protein YecT (DUF1311 family)
MLTALLLVAVLDCEKYPSDKPPAAAVAVAKKCGQDCNDRALAEQFANGKGVKRDFDAAAYFLCRAEKEMAPAEYAGMMEHLQRMRSGEEKEPLDFCQNVTSGYGMSYCANIQYEKVMPELDRRLAALRTRVTLKTEFDALRERGLAYARAESERLGEMSRGGTAYAAMSLGAEMEQKERLVTALEHFTKERAQSASDAAAKRADDELNRVYREQFADADPEWKTFLRDAQRAWIAYRDAFAAYYVQRWRGTATPGDLHREIVTQLTRDRAAELLDPGM